MLFSQQRCGGKALLHFGGIGTKRESDARELGFDGKVTFVYLLSSSKVSESDARGLGFDGKVTFFGSITSAPPHTHTHTHTPTQ